MIVMIFYLFVSFNILTHDSRGIENKEGGRYFQHRHFGMHYETRLRYSSGHGGSFNPSVMTNAEFEAHTIFTIY